MLHKTKQIEKITCHHFIEAIVCKMTQKSELLLSHESKSIQEREEVWAGLGSRVPHQPRQASDDPIVTSPEPHDPLISFKANQETPSVKSMPIQHSDHSLF